MIKAGDLSPSEQYLEVELPDGTTIGIPVELIQEHAIENGTELLGDGETSIYAGDHFTWADVEPYAVKLKPAPVFDMGQVWRDSAKAVVYDRAGSA